MARRIGILALALALVAAVVACSAPADEPEAREPTTGQTTQPAEPAPSTPPPADQAAQKRGLEFVIPDDVVPDTPEATALAAYRRYEAVVWTALTKNRVPDALRWLSEGGPRTYIEGRVREQVRLGYRLDGTVIVEPIVEQATDTEATITGCVDQSGVTVEFDRARGSSDAVDIADSYTFRASLTIGATGTDLVVSSRESTEGHC